MRTVYIFSAINERVYHHIIYVTPLLAFLTGPSNADPSIHLLLLVVLCSCQEYMACYMVTCYGPRLLLSDRWTVP